MAQSFSGSYRLCEVCLGVAERAGCVERVEAPYKRAEERVTVFAKTFQWLKQRRCL